MLVPPPCLGAEPLAPTHVSVLNKIIARKILKTVTAAIYKRHTVMVVQRLKYTILQLHMHTKKVCVCSQELIHS